MRVRNTMRGLIVDENAPSLRGLIVDEGQRALRGLGRSMGGLIVDEGTPTMSGYRSYGDDPDTIDMDPIYIDATPPTQYAAPKTALIGVGDAALLAGSALAMLMGYKKIGLTLASLAAADVVARKFLYSSIDVGF